MNMILAIAAGGALGAVARHLLSAQVTKLAGSGFPLGIMLVNVFGSLIMGLLVTMLAAKFDASPELRGFLAVGLLGGFTTFSTFSLETVILMERGDYLQVALYVVGSVLLAVLGLMAGMAMGRALV